MTTLALRLRRLAVAALGAALILAAACDADGSAPTAVETDAPATQASAPAPSAARNGAPAQPTSGTVTQAGAEPDADLAWEHIRRLSSDIGERVSGTPAEHAAAEYIAGVLRSYGYDVEMQRFPVSAFVSKSVSLATSAPQRRTFNAQPLTNSRAGEASGEIVYVGLGKEGDFTGAVRGKIALVQRGELTHQQKAAAAAAAGASALVIFNNSDEMFLGDVGQNAPAIPVLSISGAEGKALLDQLKAGPVRATLSFQGGRQESDSINVVARSPGAPCRALLGGHYDTVPSAPGASDNASGTAAVMEMARVQALRGNPEQACFAAFGSEETGLDGSRHFVRTMSAEDRQAMRFMINFDMVAFGTEWLLIGTPSLQERGKAVMNGMGLETRFIVPLGFSSDHAPFMNAGIPALFLHRSNDPLLHTPADVLDRLSKEQLGESMRIGLAFLEGFDQA